MRRAEAGFTLFEVLGAVALLALVYTMLATVAMRGLRSEGRSGRMLEASLIADWQLAEIEMQLDQGEILELGVIEIEQDNFAILIEVSSIELPTLAPRETGPLPSSSLGGRAASDGLRLPDLDSSRELFPGEPNGESPLRQIDVKVGWMEGPDNRWVSRTTYGIDPLAAQQAAANAALAAAEQARGDIGSNAPRLPGDDR